MNKVPKRFYDRAHVAAEQDGFAVLLDDRPIKTPGGAVLAVPVKLLAEAIAAEWQDQDTTPNPAVMKLTRIANTAIDRLSTDPTAVIAEMVQYGLSDMICYRAEEPAGLVERQNRHWDAIVRFAARDLDIDLATVTGLMHRDQPDGVAGRLSAVYCAIGPFGLAGLFEMTALCGSAFLPLAYRAAILDDEQAWAAANVDEDWQIEQWGEDEEAKAVRARREADFKAAILVIGATRKHGF
jgi:chaperone required for assembly of F1-ATPase